MLSTLTLVLSLAAAPSAETQRLLKSAEFAVSEHRWSDALVLAEHLLKQAPGAWQGHKIAGQALLNLDRAKDAVPHLKRWAALQPDDPRAASTAALAEKKAAGTLKLSDAAPPAATAPRGGTPSPSLGEIARQRAVPIDKAPSGVSPASATAGPAAIPPPADEVVLDTMRKRTDKLLRPRMGAVAASMKQVRSTSRQFRSNCHKQQLALAGRETVSYGSESAWVQNWAVPEGVAFDTSPQCVALANDLKALVAKVSGALRGVDRQLDTAPSVQPAVREEVFASLAKELW